MDAHETPNTLSQQIGLFLTAAQFLTRVPLPAPTDWDETRLARAARYFPAIGLCIGAMAAGVWAAAAALGLPPLAAAGLAITAQVLITGGLHEDGLADTADGLGGTPDRARALEIMRDSRIGSHGALALILSILLRVTALASLSPLAGALALIVAAALGRAGILGVLATLDYARPDGLAKGVQQIGRLEWGLGVATALAAALICGAYVAIPVACLAWAWMRWRLSVRLGGYTGDGLGATVQVVEITCLLTLAALWG